MYKELIEFHKQGKVSFQYVKTFNMDEYVGELSLKIIILSKISLKSGIRKDKTLIP